MDCFSQLICLAVVIISYLCGSIPFAAIATKFFVNKDLKTIGSGNIGATNAYRAGGKFLGLIVLVLDMSKVYIAVLICVYGLNIGNIYLCAFMAFLGHIFPIWLKFKGGKGVASAGAMLFIISPFAGIFAFMTWVIVFLLKKISSLSALCACIASLVFVASYNGITSNAFYTFLPTVLIIIAKHKDNISRLAKNQEKKLIS